MRHNACGLAMPHPLAEQSQKSEKRAYVWRVANGAVLRGAQATQPCECARPADGDSEAAEQNDAWAITATRWLSLCRVCDLMHMELPTQLKHITQWRKLKQPRLLQ